MRIISSKHPTKNMKNPLKLRSSQEGQTNKCRAKFEYHLSRCKTYMQQKIKLVVEGKGKENSGKRTQKQRK